MIDENQLQQRMQKIGELIGRLDSEQARQSRELLETVMDLHGEALDRILRRLHESGEGGEQLIQSLAADPVVSSVLLLYGLHPLDFETRLRRAVEKLAPALRPHGVYAELLDSPAGAVRVRLRGVDSAQTARTVQALVEEEIYNAAPDAASVTLVGLEKFSAPDFIPLDMVGQATVERP